MNAIELDAIAHVGKVVINLPEVYREQWNRGFNSEVQIKVSGPADFSENLDAYLSGEKWGRRPTRFLKPRRS